MPVARRPGPSLRLKLTLSYAGFLLLAGMLLLAVVWVFLLRYVPDGIILSAGPAVPNRSDLLRAFAPAAAWAVLFLLLFGLGGGWILAGRVLAPLARITRATRRAGEGARGERIRLPGRADELRELADAFDSMLDRLEARLAEQQRFAANASHELRTPLAVTQALLDVARGDPDRIDAELIERLHTVNTRAIELTEALLVLSTADQGSFELESIDLSLLAEEAEENLLPLAERRGVRLEVVGVAAVTLGSRALLLQLVSTLLHNAIVHNLPERGSIRVETASDAGIDSAVLTVENTGSPLAPEILPTLTEPFQRGTGRLHGSGVGLGLAIAASITRAHDGTLTLDARPDGGLRAIVRLPLRHPDSTRRVRDPRGD